MTVCKKVCRALCPMALVLASGVAGAQVPPDYVAPSAVYPSGSVEAQIEAVRRNYEEVKAAAQARLAAEQAAQREAQRAAQKAKEAEKARIAAQKKAAAAQKLAKEKAEAAEKARLQARQEKYEDQLRDLELELKRLELRTKSSNVRVQEAIDEEKIRRVDELVDHMIRQPQGQAK